MRKLLGFVAAAAVLGAAGSAAAAVEWTVASGGNGHYYDFIQEDTSISWTGALNGAHFYHNLGQAGYLATVTSAAENAFLVAISTDLGWLGGSDAGDEGHFTWRSGPEAGDDFTFTAWNSGEPNNCCGGEDYLQLNWSVAGGWNDAPNGSGITFPTGYFIEFDAPEPEPSAAPEPTTWALIIGGFGLAGASLRRRRQVAVRA